jgi:hypothetical protein
MQFRAKNFKPRRRPARSVVARAGGAPYEAASAGTHISEAVKLAVSAIVLSFLIFALVLGGICLGAALRRLLPLQHLSKESQDVVRLGVGLIATMAALVLGLLIASAKTTYDTQSTQVKQITANIILLDTMLEQYGVEAQPIRKGIREELPILVEKMWLEKREHKKEHFETLAGPERIYAAIQKLSPKDDVQKPLQTRLVQIANDIAQTRMLLFVGAGESMPRPFLVILVFWLVIIFASFSLFSELNRTVMALLALFAFSASCGIFLILELSQPFTGIMTIPSDTLRNVLAPLAS